MLRLLWSQPPASQHEGSGFWTSLWPRRCQVSDTFGVHPNLQETGHQDIPTACAAAKASSEASLDSSKTYGRTPGLSQCRGSFQPSRHRTFLSSALASLRQKYQGWRSSILVVRTIWILIIVAMMMIIMKVKPQTEVTSRWDWVKARHMQPVPVKAVGFWNSIFIGWDNTWPTKSLTTSISGPDEVTASASSDFSTASSQQLHSHSPPQGNSEANGLWSSHRVPKKGLLTKKWLQAS